MALEARHRKAEAACLGATSSRQANRKVVL